jgi:copper transport protein
MVTATARRPRNPARWVLAALVLATVVVGSGTVADAHASLESTDPPNGAVLASAPAGVTLSFDEPVQATSDAVRVFDPSGDPVAVGRVEVRDRTLVAALPRTAARGTYTVTWKVVSADGHVVDGAFIYSVGAATATSPVVPSGGPSASPPASLALRALGTAVELGALVVVLLLALRRRDGGAPDRRDQLAWVAALAGAVLALAGTLWSIDTDARRAVDVLSRGPTGVALGAGVAITTIGIVAARRPRAWVLAVVAVAIAALPGHAVAVSPVWRSASLTALHVLAAATWATALLWLAATADARIVARIRRFSPVGMVAVVVLALTGAVLLVTRTGWGELVSSAYGRVGLVKVLLLLVAVALAARNRWMLTPRVERGDDGALPALRSAIRAEVLVLALALVAGVALGQMAFPVGSAAAGGPYSDVRPFGDGRVRLLVDPAQVGPNEVHVTALTSAGTLMADVQDLSVELRLPSRNLGPLRPDVSPIVPGHVVAQATLTVPGDWLVTVVGYRGKFDELRTTFEVRIGP